MMELKFTEPRPGYWEAKQGGCLFAIRQTSRDNFAAWVENLLSNHRQPAGWFRTLANAKTRLGVMANQAGKRKS